MQLESNNLNKQKVQFLILILIKNYYYSKSNILPSLSNELNLVKLLTYDCNKSSIIGTFSLFLYKDRKSTNNGGTPLWKPARRYESISLLNVSPKM